MIRLSTATAIPYFKYINVYCFYYYQHLCMCVTKPNWFFFYFSRIWNECCYKSFQSSKYLLIKSIFSWNSFNLYQSKSVNLKNEFNMSWVIGNEKINFRNVTSKIANRNGVDHEDFYNKISTCLDCRFVSMCFEVSSSLRLGDSPAW